MAYKSQSWSLSDTKLEALCIAQRKMERAFVEITLLIKKTTTWIRTNKYSRHRRQTTTVGGQLARFTDINKMKESRIVLPAVKQGTRSSVNNHIEVEKFADRSNSFQNENLSRPRNGILPTSGHSGSPTIHSREKRNKWTREEYEEVIYCFYYTLKNPMSSKNTNDTYITWCQRNNESNKMKYMNANKLANQRRYIIRNKN